MSAQTKYTSDENALQHAHNNNNETVDEDKKAARTSGEGNKSGIQEEKKVRQCGYFPILILSIIRISIKIKDLVK